MTKHKRVPMNPDGSFDIPSNCIIDYSKSYIVYPPDHPIFRAIFLQESEALKREAETASPDEFKEKFKRYIDYNKNMHDYMMKRKRNSIQK